MKNRNHPNIIKLLGKCSTNPLYLIIEHMKNGNLSHFLTSEIGQKLNFNQILQIAEDISNGMRYLEYLNIVHGDLATRNIQVGDFDYANGKFAIKIADFEQSHFLHEKDYKEVPFTESCLFYI